MKKKYVQVNSDGCRGKFEMLWEHANAGNTLAVIPCNETRDFLQVGQRLVTTGVSGWFGFGRNERGPEDFVVAISEKDATGYLRTFVRRVQADLHLSAIITEGFDVTLFMTICRTGNTEAVLQEPFGVTSRIDESPNGLVLSFDPPPPQPDLRPTEWLETLQRAYSDLLGYESFIFEGHYEW